MPLPTDADLLRSSATDADAFLVVYDRWSGLIFGWLVRRTGNRTVAADLTAETFAQALEHAGRFRPEAADGSAGPWLFGIAANLLRRAARTAEVETRARRRLGMSVVPFSADDTALAEEAVERVSAEAAGEGLRDALAGLPEPQREAILLRVVDDLEYDEIARLQQTTNQAVRLRVSRGLRRLRTRMEDS